MKNIAKRKEKRERNRAILIEHLGGHCAWCNTTSRLEFDHVKPDDKLFNIATHLEHPLEKLLQEIKKCQLLCRICHAIKTRIDQGHSKAKHGSHGMYTNHGCRCIACKSANTEYYRNKKMVTA